MGWAYPPGGFESAKKMNRNRIISNTCSAPAYRTRNGTRASLPAPATRAPRLPTAYPCTRCLPCHLAYLPALPTLYSLTSPTRQREPLTAPSRHRQSRVLSQPHRAPYSPASASHARQPRHARDRHTSDTRKAGYLVACPACPTAPPRVRYPAYSLGSSIRSRRCTCARKPPPCTHCQPRTRGQAHDRQGAHHTL